MKGNLTKQQVFALKAATRRLIEAAGGLEAAEHVCRIHRSQLSNCQNNNADQFLPVDALVELTSDTGNRCLMQEIKRMLKGVGIDPEHTPEAMHRDMRIAHREGAESINVTMEALDDDRLEIGELRRIEKEADDAAQAFMRVRDRARRQLAALTGE